MFWTSILNLKIFNSIFFNFCIDKLYANNIVPDLMPNNPTASSEFKFLSPGVPNVSYEVEMVSWDNVN